MGGVMACLVKNVRFGFRLVVDVGVGGIIG